MGWRISAGSAIVRSAPLTEWTDGSNTVEVNSGGVPTYGPDDVFLLDGQRLVPCDDSLGCPLPDEQSQPYVEKTYRTEQNDFARVELWFADADGDSDIDGDGTDDVPMWVVTRPNGVKYYYTQYRTRYDGQGPGGSVELPAMDNIYSWKLTRVDDFGNYMDFQWGYPGTGPDNTFGNGGSRHVLQRVEYGGRDADGDGDLDGASDLPHRFRVDFNYVDLDGNIGDKIRTFQGGRSLRTWGQLDAVEVYSLANGSQSPIRIRKYKLEYEPIDAGDYRRRLLSIQEFGKTGSIEDLPSGDVAYPKHVFDYRGEQGDEISSSSAWDQEVGLLHGLEAPTDNPPAFSNALTMAGNWLHYDTSGQSGIYNTIPMAGRYQMIDLNGDGLSDLVNGGGHGQYTTEESNGSPAKVWIRRTIPEGEPNEGELEWHADTDWSNALGVLGFSPPGQEFKFIDFGNGQSAPFFVPNGSTWVDLNGDRLPDIVRTNSYAGGPPTAAIDNVWLCTLANGTPTYQGQGDSDLAASYEAFFDAEISSGTPQFDLAPKDPGLGYRYKASNIRFMELNGDGLVDIVRWAGSYGDQIALGDAVWLNTGTGFEEVSWGWPLSPFENELFDAKSYGFVENVGFDVAAKVNRTADNGYLTGDVNGDGLVDLVQLLRWQPAGGPSTQDRAFVYLNTGSAWGYDEELSATFYNSTGSPSHGNEVLNSDWIATTRIWEAPGYVTKDVVANGVTLIDINSDGYADLLKGLRIEQLSGSQPSGDYDGGVDTFGAFLNKGRDGFDETSDSRWELPVPLAYRAVDSGGQIYTYSTGVAFGETNGDRNIDVVQHMYWESAVDQFEHEVGVWYNAMEDFGNHLWTIRNPGGGLTTANYEVLSGLDDSGLRASAEVVQSVKKWNGIEASDTSMGLAHWESTTEYDYLFADFDEIRHRPTGFRVVSTKKGPGIPPITWTPRGPGLRLRTPRD